jgi:imidazolonepropionase-like amidohydrolase
MFPQKSATPLAITNATVIPMNRQRVLENHTVVIVDGWIEAVAPAGAIDTSAMQIVDGAGKYLLPALADMHVHYWMPGDAALFLANGVATVRNMSGAPFHLALQQQVETGKHPGPRIVTTSPTLEADAFMLPMWKYLADADLAEPLVAQYVGRGYQQIKVLNSIPAETLRALGKACRNHGVRLTGHCPQAVTYEEAIEAGMTCFEHFLGIWKGHLSAGAPLDGQSNISLDVIEAMAHHLDFEAIRRLAGHMAAQQIWNCPTLVTDQFMHLPQENGLAHPQIASVLPYVPQAVLPLWEMLDSSRRQGEQRARWLQAIQSRVEASLAVIDILHQEGAPLLVGTDTSVRFVIQGFSVHAELENFVRAGLTPFEAIRCATVEPARFLGLTSQLGTVSKNKRAELILVNENPLERVGALHKPEAIFVNGFYLPRSELDALLGVQAAVAKRTSVEVRRSADEEREAHDAISMSGGALIEMAGATPKGILRYRHERLADGGWRVKETYEFEQNSIYDIGGRRLRSTQLHLDIDLRLKSGRIVEESFAGSAYLELLYSHTGCYLVHQVDEDGFDSHYEVAVVDALLPDISLAVTILMCPAFEKALDAAPSLASLYLLPSVELERMSIGYAVVEIVNIPQTTFKEIHVKTSCDHRNVDALYTFRQDSQLENCRYGWSQFLPEQLP